MTWVWIWLYWFGKVTTRQTDFYVKTSFHYFLSRILVVWKWSWECMMQAWEISLALSISFSFTFFHAQYHIITSWRLNALPHGRETPTSRATWRCGMWIPTQQSAVKWSACSGVVRDKHVLLSRQREVLSFTTCALSLGEILAQVYVHSYHCIHLATFFKQSRSYNYKVKL